ncbi:MAG: hypothetical protein V1711_03205 [bacterium]
MSGKKERKIQKGSRSDAQQQEIYWREIGRQFANLGGFSTEDADSGFTHIWACFKMYEAERKTKRMRATTLARIIEAAGKRISLKQVCVSSNGELENRRTINGSAFTGRDCLGWLADTAIACAVYDYLKSRRNQEQS